MLGALLLTALLTALLASSFLTQPAVEHLIDATVRDPVRLLGGTLHRVLDDLVNVLPRTLLAGTFLSRALLSGALTAVTTFAALVRFVIEQRSRLLPALLTRAALLALTLLTLLTLLALTLLRLARALLAGLLLTLLAGPLTGSLTRSRLRVAHGERPSLRRSVPAGPVTRSRPRARPVAA